MTGARVLGSRDVNDAAPPAKPSQTKTRATASATAIVPCWILSRPREGLDEGRLGTCTHTAYMAKLMDLISSFPRPTALLIVAQQARAAGHATGGHSIAVLARANRL